MIDPSVIKGLLKDGSVEEIRSSASSILEELDHSDLDEEETKILQALVLLWNRVVKLQKEQGASSSEQASSLAEIGNLWIKIGEHDKALGQCKKALAMDSSSVATLKCLGLAHFQKSDYAAATEYYGKAIKFLEHEPDQTKLGLAYSELASVYEGMGQFPTAMTTLEKAMEIIEDDAGVLEASPAAEDEKPKIAVEVYEHMGTLCDKMGKYKAAESALQKAHSVMVATRGESDPKTQEISYLLDMAKTNAGSN